MPKVNVKRAAASKTAMNLDSSHVTTFEFGQTRPIMYRHMNPSEKIDVDLAMMVRSSPLNFPSYGGIRFIHRGFFVPYRLISPKFEDFFRGRTINVSGVQSDVYIPTFTNFGILRIFTSVNKLPSGIVNIKNTPDRKLYSEPDVSGKPLGFALSSYDSSFNTYFNIPQSVNLANSFYQVQNGFIKCNCRAWQTVGPSYIPPVPVDVNNNDIPYDFFYDICVNPDADNDSQNQIYVRCFAQFKPYGRFILKVLNSLGYNITFPFKDQSFFDFYQDASGKTDPTSVPSKYVDTILFESVYEEKYNAFALLAYLRILFDNYLPSQYATNSIFNALFVWLNDPGVYTSGQNMELDSNQQTFLSASTSPMVSIMSTLLYYGFQVFAGSDYFTDAWYNQNSVISGQFSDVSSSPGVNNLGISSFKDVPNRSLTSFVDVSDDSVNFSFNRGTVSPNSNNVVWSASASGHKWLNSLYNLFLRSNLAGSRIGETLLSVFGIKAPSAKLDKSVYLGKKMNDFVIGDVTAFATTEDSQGKELGVLGEYAGKGFSLSEHDKGNNFSYEADEWGVFLILSSTIADGGYVQGIDRMNLITDRFDFYQPELEKTGMQPTLVEEFLAPPSNLHPGCYETSPRPQNNYASGNCFGFLPRYSFMKKPLSLLTGDFNIKSLGGTRFGELQAYHTFRLFQNPNFVYGPNSLAPDENEVSSLVQPLSDPVAQGQVLFDNGGQYNRIFSVQDNQQDHFFAVISFKTKLITPMIGMANSIDLDGFNEIEMQMNGTAMD